MELTLEGLPETLSRLVQGPARCLGPWALSWVPSEMR